VSIGRGDEPLYHDPPPLVTTRTPGVERVMTAADLICSLNRALRQKTWNRKFLINTEKRPCSGDTAQPPLLPHGAFMEATLLLKWIRVACFNLTFDKLHNLNLCSSVRGEKLKATHRTTNRTTLAFPPRMQSASESKRSGACLLAHFSSRIRAEQGTVGPLPTHCLERPINRPRCRWCFRIFDFDPCSRRTRAIN
jgi:hypothetical protein